MVAEVTNPLTLVTAVAVYDRFNVPTSIIAVLKGVLVSTYALVAASPDRVGVAKEVILLPPNETLAFGIVILFKRVVDR